MDLFIHPYSLADGRSLLHLLIEELNSKRWNKFQMAVAFAKESANTLYPDLLSALTAFAEAGNHIHITFGCDKFGSKKGSEFAALQTLTDLFSSFPEAQIYLYHDKARIFHPKIYLFSNEPERQALLVIGSSNWNDSAFSRNVEANVAIKLDLNTEADAQHFAMLQQHFCNDWSENPTSFARKINAEFLNRISPLLAHRIEADAGDADGDASAVPSSPQDQAYSEAELLFSGNRRTYDMPFRRRHTPTRNSQPRQVPEIGRQLESDMDEANLIWIKRELSPSDAQTPPSDRTSVTGVVRLTQDNFSINGALIDHKRYFRRDAFGDLDWAIVQDEPLKEEAIAKFHIVLPDSDLGIHALKISHQESRIAEQGNIPTVLHWGKGGLVQQIGNSHLAGMKLSLFRTDTPGNFLIKISRPTQA